jgi:hypothetical protein
MVDSIDRSYSIRSQAMSRVRSHKAIRIVKTESSHSNIGRRLNAASPEEEHATGPYSLNNISGAVSDCLRARPPPIPVRPQRQQQRRTRLSHAQPGPQKACRPN